MIRSTRKEWIFNVLLLLAVILTGLWTAFDRGVEAQSPTIKPPRLQKKSGITLPKLPAPPARPAAPNLTPPTLPKGVSLKTPAPPVFSTRPTPQKTAKPTPRKTAAPRPRGALPNVGIVSITPPARTPVKTPGTPGAAKTASPPLAVTPAAPGSTPAPGAPKPTTTSTLTSGTTLTSATTTAKPSPTPWVKRYLYIGRVNPFSALITPTPTPTPPPPRPPTPPNLKVALRYYAIDYYLKKKTIWVFHDTHKKGTTYQYEINKPIDLFDGRTKFQATLILDPNDKYGVIFVYPNPPEVATQTAPYSMVK